MLRKITYLIFFLSNAAGPVFSEGIFAANLIRNKSIVSMSDVLVKEGDFPDAVKDVNEVIGKEAKKNIFPGKPILEEDLRDAALLERNESTRLLYRSGALFMAAEGIVLSRGYVGKKVRVMNESSRSIVVGIVLDTGEVLIENR